MSFPSRVYRLIKRGEWTRGEWYKGSPKDLKDGFIHLSTQQQVGGTYEKHFRDMDASVLVIDLKALESHGVLRWEAAPSRSNELFAHFYSPNGIPPAAIVDEIEVDDMLT